jgi:hypothetical protein
MVDHSVLVSYSLRAIRELQVSVRMGLASPSLTHHNHSLFQISLWISLGQRQRHLGVPLGRRVQLQVQLQRVTPGKHFVLDTARFSLLDF